MTTGFYEFWELYPRKCGKLKAEPAYRKALKLTSHDDIMDGVRRYLKSKPAYADWAHPTTWLNAGRWMDEPDKITKVNGEQSLEVIAAHVRRPWCEPGCYPRDVLEQCVAAELLTRDEMEAAL